MEHQETTGGSARLHLIRHGETAWSASGRHTGRTDLSLTARGEWQARALENRLRPTRFAHVFCSPAQRARQTCALAGLRPLVERFDPDLQEWDYGDYEGLTSVEIRKDRPGWDCYRDGAPGGETVDDVSARADRLLARLVLLGGNVALFTHGEFACSLAARWIGQPVAQGRHLQLATASLSVLGFNPAHPGLRVLSLWNEVPAAVDGHAIPVDTLAADA